MVFHTQQLNIFMLHKKSDKKLTQRVVARANTPAYAKSLGKMIKLRYKWDEMKLHVMLYALQYKFSPCNPILRKQLLSTGDKYLQEGNYHNDTYWGFCLKKNVGDNHLGILLMQVRKEISEETTN